MKASIGRLRYLAARKSSSSSSRSLRLSTTPTTSLTKCPNTTRSPISANSTTQPRSEQRRASTTASTASTSSFSSINADEISHFSRLSSQWWDRTGEFGLLHRMNPARVEYIRRKVALDPDDEPRWTFEDRWKGQERDEGRGTGRWLAGKECLDVGCGGGLLSESLARLGGSVTGVDASESNIAIATLHASQDPLLPFNDLSTLLSSSSSGSSSSIWQSRNLRPGESSSSTQSGSLRYRHSSAETLRDEGRQFDLVCAMEVVEHVDQPGEFMKCLGDLVKPGGHLILSTISRTPLSRLLTLTLAESVLRLVTPGTHTYSKFIKPDELRHFVWAEMGGYDTWEKNKDASDIRTREVGSTQGIVYDPLAGSWKLWDGTEGTWGKGLGEGCNYVFHAKKRAV